MPLPRPFKESPTEKAMQMGPLALNLFQIVYGASNHDLPPDIASDLACLMGAILQKRQVEWEEDRPILQILRGSSRKTGKEYFGVGHRVWDHILFVDGNGHPVDQE